MDWNVYIYNTNIADSSHGPALRISIQQRDCLQVTEPVVWSEEPCCTCWLFLHIYIYIQYIHTHIIHVGLYLPTFFYQITQLCNSTMHCNCGKFGGDPNLQCFQAHGFLYMHLSSTNLRSSELWTLYMVFCMPRNRYILPKWWQNEVQNHRLLELSHHLFTNPWDLPSRMRGFQDFNSINVGDPTQKTYYLEIIETHKIHGFGYIWFLTLDLPH